jgi:hypothetical protein
MQLGKPNPAAPQPHSGNTFQLPPPAFAVSSTQSADIMNTAADGNGLNIRDFADDLEAHLRIKSVVSAGFKKTPNARHHPPRDPAKELENYRVRGRVHAVVSRRDTVLKLMSF